MGLVRPMKKIHYKHMGFNMSIVNENLLAEEVARREGGKQKLSIAQVKEVMRHTLDILGENWSRGNEEDVIYLIKNHIPRGQDGTGIKD